MIIVLTLGALIGYNSIDIYKDNNNLNTKRVVDVEKNFKR